MGMWAEHTLEFLITQFIHRAVPEEADCFESAWPLLPFPGRSVPVPSCTCARGSWINAVSQFEIVYGILGMVLLQPELASKGECLNLSRIHGNRTVELGQRVFTVTWVKAQRSFRNKIVQIGGLRSCPNRLRDFVTIRLIDCHDPSDRMT